MEQSERLLILPEAESTNNVLMGLAKADSSLPELYCVVALNQTAGRGQRGNSWLVSPGQNLTYSVLIRLESVSASAQYVVSELVAVTVVTALRSYLGRDKDKLQIKWPNDIYFGDKKLAGILIEHSITGAKIDYSVAGIGLNVNETDFHEDLPNPISLRQITGEKYELKNVHALLMANLSERIEEVMLGHYSKIHKEYMSMLYRRDGVHTYHDEHGTFFATIEDVLPSGHLVLRTEEGERREYAFKEVVFDADKD